jgi:hypothetical protein
MWSRIKLTYSRQASSRSSTSFTAYRIILELNSKDHLGKETCRFQKVFYFHLVSPGRGLDVVIDEDN